MTSRLSARAAIGARQHALDHLDAGILLHADGTRPRFNQANPKLPNFLAAKEELLADFRADWLP